MSALDEALAEIVRKVVREELQSISANQPEELLTAEDVRRLLSLNNVQKVYSLAREGEIEPVMISKREMRFSPSVILEFQLKKGIRAA